MERIALQMDKAFSAEVKDLESKKAELKSYLDQADKLNWRELTLDQKVDLDRELGKITKQLGEIDNEIQGRRGAYGRGSTSLSLLACSQQSSSWRRRFRTGTSRRQSLHDYGLNNGIPAEKLIPAYFTDRPQLCCCGRPAVGSASRFKA